MSSISVRRPDFFIVGAPKSGTTSLAHYLNGHPEISMSRPKEPHFFCTDFHMGDARTLPEYLECFRDADELDLAVGEASASYLASEVAIRNILDFNSEARFIAMIRNPVVASYAFFGELRWNGQESAIDFERAWELQEARRHGEQIPAACREPCWLQYRHSFLLGEQLARLLHVAGRDRLHVVVFDDFVADTRVCYREVLAFLGVPDDGRREFPVLNRSKAARSRLLSLALYWLGRSKQALGLPKFNLGFAKGLLRLNSYESPREPLSPVFLEHVIDAFREDVHLLERLLDRDLTHWIA